MQFGPEPLERAEGKILGHNVTDRSGRRVLRKGAALSARDVETLRELGRRLVYVATPSAGDVDEDRAAERITRSTVSARGARFSGPRTGRVNVYATERAVVRVDVERLLALNELDGVTLATLPHHSSVPEGKMVATAKILPYAVAEETVRRAEGYGAAGPIVELEPLPQRRVALVVSGGEGSREKTVSGFETALRRRLLELGSVLERVVFVAADEEQAEDRLAERLQELAPGEFGLIVMAGETAVQDRADLAPRAIERAGGEVVCFGAPVDPGNLLLLGRLGKTPVLGAPGCARSPKRNIIDLVLPRLLLGERIGRRDIVALGHGGLLEDVPERPFPRSQV